MLTLPFVTAEILFYWTMKNVKMFIIIIQLWACVVLIPFTANRSYTHYPVLSSACVGHHLQGNMLRVQSFFLVNLVATCGYHELLLPFYHFKPASLVFYDFSHQQANPGLFSQSE